MLFIIITLLTIISALGVFIFAEWTYEVSAKAEDSQREWEESLSHDAFCFCGSC